MQKAVHQQPSGDLAPASSAENLLGLALRTRETRRRLRGLFPVEIFNNSAWDLMIELFITQTLKQRMCVKELILASGESSTSAMRRIDRLQGADFIRRRLDDEDHRRVWVELTEKGYTSMVLMLEQLYEPSAQEQPARPTSFKRRAD